jgi:hypothetical protein
MKSNSLFLRLFVILSCFSFISCNNCRDIDVEYYEDEPYEAIEEEEISLPYNVGSSTHTRETGLVILGDMPTVHTSTTLTNTHDEKGGLFTVHINVKTDLGRTIELEDTKFISAGETETYEMEKDIKPFEEIEGSKYIITAPTVTVSKKVTKNRSVKKFRRCNSCDENCR